MPVWRVEGFELKVHLDFRVELQTLDRGQDGRVRQERSNAKGKKRVRSSQ